jgi:DNA-binding response OmpR family regulator
MGVKVLIVDDDASFGTLLQRRLERRGLHVVFRDTPFGIVNELGRGQYDVVVLDVRMPALDGTHLSRLIRSRPRLGSAAILLCSSMDDDELQQLTREYGATGYFNKSWNIETIVAKILGASTSAAS